MNENTAPLPANPHPAPKPPACFHANNCTREFRHGGYQFDFKPYDQLAGTWRGLFHTFNESEAAAVRALASKDPTITEITPEDYARRLKKTNRDLVSGYNPLILQPLQPAPMQAAIEKKPVVIVENPSPSVAAPQVTSEPVDVEAAIKVAAIAPAPAPEAK